MLIRKGKRKEVINTHIRAIQLFVFVRYVQKAGTKLELKEEFLFYESLQTTATATDVMNFIRIFVEKHDIPLEKIGFVCTDGAPAMFDCNYYIKYYCLLL